MPHNKALKKMEKLKEKGLEVSYPSVPYFTDNYDKIMNDRAEKKRRMDEAQNAEFLPIYPSPRTPYAMEGVKKYRRDKLPMNFRFPN